MSNSIWKKGYIIVSSKEILSIKKKLRASIVKASNHIIKLNTKERKKFTVGAGCKVIYIFSREDGVARSTNTVRDPEGRRPSPRANTSRGRYAIDASARRYTGQRRQYSRNLTAPRPPPSGQPATRATPRRRRSPQN